MHLISLNFYLFQKKFASLRGPKWVLFRLKRFLLEALPVTLFADAHGQAFSFTLAMDFSNLWKSCYRFNNASFRTV